MDSAAPVSESEVLDYWLSLEARKPWETLDAAAIDAAPATRQSTLRDLRAYQTAFLDAYDLRWSRRTLSEADLRRLRVIPGDPESSWRRLSPDGTILGAARRLLGRPYRGFFADVYVDLVYLLADHPREAAANQTLVVIDDPAEPGPFVIDGNHHATARALRLLERGEYLPLSAFVGTVRGRRDASAAPAGGRSRDVPTRGEAPRRGDARDGTTRRRADERTRRRADDRASGRVNGRLRESGGPERNS
jgi:hypothetical protein